jgi:hypothetical protein
VVSKLVYFCFLGAICLSVCGLITMAAQNRFENSTPVTVTIGGEKENPVAVEKIVEPIPVKEETPITEEVEDEEPLEDIQEGTPKSNNESLMAAMKDREVQQLLEADEEGEEEEKATISEEEDAIEENTPIEEENVIKKNGSAPVNTTKPKQIPIQKPTLQDGKQYKRTVGSDGKIDLGKENAGMEVIVTPA